MIDLLSFLFLKVSCKISRVGEYARLVSESVSSLPITYFILPADSGIAAVDRLYPLKPKQPV
ncbi:hypothetical protein [Algoriphagus jejuensis]|uniref:hypothetical protein n=1 Tax=Algoriphagus jejuensis TaxID=419934 RepID=UPI0031D2761C